MNEATIKDILMDIIVTGNKYTISDLLEDEDFNTHRELALAECVQYDYIRKLIIEYSYTQVNAAMVELLDYKKGTDKCKAELTELIENLDAGYDADPAQAPKELERMCDLCAKAADYLEGLV